MHTTLITVTSSSTSSFTYLIIGLFIVMLIVIALLIALIPAFVAKSKGYSFFGFFIFSVFLFIPALIVALCLKSQQQKQQEIQAAISSDYGHRHQEIARQINELSDMKSKGFLSEAEFQAAKDKILMQ